MAKVQEQEDRAELLVLMEIALYHLTPTCLGRLARARIAVAREVHKIHRAVHAIKIDGLGLTGLRRSPRERLAVYKRV